MDNASKALIMAGAVLIAIALVSLGVYLYTTAKEGVESGVDQIDVMNMQMQNSQLLKYEGSKVRGSLVKQMIEYIDNVNILEAMPTFVDYGSVDKNKVRASGYYKVVCEDTNSDGYIDEVTITGDFSS